MKHNLIALSSGTVFGLGLAISQMINPAKVRNFLDISGAWDPSLAFVMVGAAVVFFAAWRISLGQSQPLFGHGFERPRYTKILDPRLLGGSAVFGIGWGMAGLCPGPAISSLAYLMPQALVFVLAMVVGSYLANWLPPERELTTRPASS